MFEEGGEQRDSDPQKCREYDHMEERPQNLTGLRILFASGFTKFLSFQQSIFTDSPSVSYLYLYTSAV